MISCRELSAITKGTIIQHATEKPIAQLLLDSRKLIIASESLFFAMKGKNHDSHQFIPTLYAQGVRQFVVEQRVQDTYQHLVGANIIQVANSIDVLQEVASRHRCKFQLPVLAITGSNAKTIVKEWLSQLLALKYHVVKSPKSYNSQIGVPLSVWLMSPAHSYGVFEAGISMPGEMSKLEAIIRPTKGIFTNIGSAHDQSFADWQQKVYEKALLFKGCQTIFYCLDHHLIHQGLTTLYQGKAQLVNWSLDDNHADFKVRKRLTFHSRQTILTIINQQQEHTFTLPFQDDVSVENAVHCIVFLLHEGLLSGAMLQAGLKNLRKVPMRLTLRQGINNCQIIDDTYNNDLVGLQVALDFMAQQKQGLKRTVILSDMLQTGVPAEQLYSQIAQLLQGKQVGCMIGVGEEITAHAAAFTAFETRFYDHTASLLKGEVQGNFSNTLILVKGARKFGLERIVDQLQEKIHSTVLEINLDAIGHNLNFFRSKLAPSTRIMVIVKALSYGNSSFEIANFLQHHHVAYLAVAYTDEGIMLREHGITLPIMVMNPTPESFYKLLEYNLEPEIYSLRLLQALRDFLSSQKRHAKVHLKLETGMHRLGFAESELNLLIQLLQDIPAIEVVGIMSHLAASSAPQHDAYTQQQATLFINLATHLEQALGISTIKHLLNSSGILRFPDYQLDMVRLGIGLYGVGVGQAMEQHLEVVSTLKTIVSQIKEIPKGATIGYNRVGGATKDMQIATIAIGYADGFSRSLGNGRGSVWINGYRAPVVGSVCMDMTMVDVTDIPVDEGDEVIVFGRELPIAEVATVMNTLPYEVLTRVSERIRRMYYTN